MKVGVVYPIGTDDPVDPVVIRAVKEATCAHVLRYNIRPDERGRKNQQALDACLGAGFEPLPIVELPYDAVEASSQAITQWADWAVGEIAAMADVVDIVELGNEPVTRPNGGAPMRAEVYAAYAHEIAIRLGASVPRVRVAAAMDAMRPGGWPDPRWYGWWVSVRERMIYDLAAIHPYRDGAQWPNESRIAWPPWGWLHRNPRLGSMLRLPVHRRGDEHAWWVREARQPVIVTEVGYSRRYLDDVAIAARTVAELDFYAGQGVELVCLYAYGGPEWGLVDHLRPRPAADAVKAWIG